MKPEYRPKTLHQKLGYLIEECGEVMAAAGKTLRWGLLSTNPDLPKEDAAGNPIENETNAQWILRELKDLRNAIAFVEVDLIRREVEEVQASGKSLTLLDGILQRGLSAMSHLRSTGNMDPRPGEDEELAALCIGTPQDEGVVPPKPDTTKLFELLDELIRDPSNQDIHLIAMDLMVAYRKYKAITSGG